MTVNLEKLQEETSAWTQACFGNMISADVIERNHRFCEEALELVQSLGMGKSDAYQLVDYVYNRPEGEPLQEIGGVIITLCALANANGLSVSEGASTEMARIWTKVEAIRTKQANKPQVGPLASGDNHGSELQYLRWYHHNSDWSNQREMQELYQDQTGASLPKGYNYADL